MSKLLAPVIGFTFLVQLIAFIIGVGNNVILSRWLGPEAVSVFAVGTLALRRHQRLARRRRHRLDDRAVRPELLVRGEPLPALGRDDEGSGAGQVEPCYGTLLRHAQGCRR